MEAERVAHGEPFEQSRIEARKVIGDIQKAVLRRGAGLHSAIVGGEIEIHQHRLLLALREYAGEIDCERGGSGAARGAQERVDLS